MKTLATANSDEAVCDKLPFPTDSRFPKIKRNKRRVKLLLAIIFGSILTRPPGPPFSRITFYVLYFSRSDFYGDHIPTLDILWLFQAYWIAVWGKSPLNRWF